MSFQFLRDEWFLMLIPLLFIAYLLWKQRYLSRDWAAVIDASLLPHLISGRPRSGHRWFMWLALLVSLLVVLALAGPVWNKLPLPVFKQQSALIIALDLSQSMNAEDIKPSRLARARLKLIDILKVRNEGQTALLAYAANPYTVSPLTDDSDTIQSLVSSLTSEIMPTQGSRSDLALEHAIDLLKNAGQMRGDILLITDGISEQSMQAMKQLDTQQVRVSILSVGTEQGAPIPQLDAGFVKDADGSIVISKTLSQPLQQLTSELGGRYLSMKLDDGDVIALQALFDKTLETKHQQTDFKADRWREEGPWLLLLVTPLAALAFRRGVLLSLFVMLLIIPLQQPVYAEDGWSWQRLWKNQDQRAEQMLKQGKNEQAAELFNSPEWKAGAHYKAGQYEQALQQFESQDSPTADYNRANTLAKMGQLEQALEAYNELLEQNPDHEDASYNRKLVEEALQQQQQQDQSQQQDGEQSQQDQQSADDAAQQDQQQQSDADKSSDENSQENQGQSENEQQSDSDPQQSEQEQQEQEQQQDAEAESEAQQAQADEQESTEQQDEAEASSPLSESEKLEQLTQQAEEQWLRRIPDDPGGLLRNKFKYQYGRQRQPVTEEEQW